MMRLRVKPFDDRDPGADAAVVDRDSFRDLGLSPDDYVAIEGSEGARAIASVEPGESSDAGRGVVRIGEQTRRSVGVDVGDHVKVERVEVEPADRLTVATRADVGNDLLSKLRINANLETVVREEFEGHALTPGERMVYETSTGLISRSNQRVPLWVVDTAPGNAVVITETTEVEITDESVEEIFADDRSETTATVPDDITEVSYEDVGGLDDELEQVREMIELPMRHPELFRSVGIEPPKGVLMYGPPGTGKTLIARTVASEIDANFQTISGPEIMSRKGGAEERLREVFEEAEENAPSIVFADEIDSIAPKREDVGEAERRAVAQLLSLMDGLDERGEVVVIGATNRVDAVDTALRRGGRFDREIEVGVPDRDGRREILDIHARGVPLGADVDLDRYAEHTQGFVGADLETLVREAAMRSLRRIRPDIDLDGEISAGVLDAIEVTDGDFRRALRGVEPSALREVFVEVPDVTWDDVGGLGTAKNRLRETVQWPLEHADAYERVDLDPAKGILLHGPPGTGKTLLAKAVANEAQSNFISIKGPELLNKYVGESEKGVREVFAKARENAPTVVFFDEIDAIAAERGSGGGDSNVGERVVSQLLTELDGLEELEDVVVIATSNRPDLIDDALLRPGRLDRHIAVDQPYEAARREIFEVHVGHKPLADDVDLDALAARTEGYVGADIEAVCREAAQIAVREHVRRTAGGESAAVNDIDLTMAHFEQALDEVDAGDER